MIRVLKYLVIILLSSLAAKAQIYIKPNNSYGVTQNRTRGDSTVLIPTFCGTPSGKASLHSIDQRMSAIIYDSCGHRFYVFDPSDSSWTKLGATQINDSTVIVGRDTVIIRGTGVGCNLNPSYHSTDISAPLQAIINSGCKRIFIQKGNYNVGATIQMSDSVVIQGEGRGTNLNITGNFPAFKCSYSLGGNKCQFLDISFSGNRGTGTTNQEAIFSDSANGIYINNISGYKLSGFAIRFRNNGFCCGSYPVPTGVLGNIISNVWIDSCYGGIKFDTSAEYNSINNSTVVKSTYGVVVAGGNCRVNGNNLSGNTYGLYLTGGSNNGHGIAGNNTINHNTYNAYLTGVTLGYVFTGNQFYAASTENIHIDNCDIIKFYGGSIAGSTIISTTNTNTLFSDVRVTATFSISGESPTVIENGKLQNGFSFSDVSSSTRMDLKHTNKVGTIDFNGSSGKVIVNDTINSHYIYGGSNSTDTLYLNSTSNSTVTSAIKFGKDDPANGIYAGAWNTRNGFVGIGTLTPQQPLQIRNRRSGFNAEIILTQDLDCSGCASRITFQTPTSSTTGQIFTGSASNAFMPLGMLIHSSGANGVKIATGGGSGQDIEFAGSSTRFTSSWALFKGGTGNLLINTTSDNAIGKLQVNGKVTIATIDSSNSPQNILFSDNNGEIKKASLYRYGIYTALLNQSGTSAPTATVLGTNTIGSIVWTRSSAGIYVGTLSGAFTSGKTWATVGWSDESAGGNIVFRLKRTGNNTVELFCSSDGVTSSDVFTNLSIEIRVYP